MAGSRIYALIGIIIFGFLAYVMFMNNFNYIKYKLMKAFRFVNDDFTVVLHNSSYII